MVKLMACTIVNTSGTKVMWPSSAMESSYPPQSTPQATAVHATIVEHTS